MIKEELNKEIEKLKVSLEAHEEQVKDLSHDLKIATQRLVDCDKPKLTESQFSSIHEVVETAISDFNFNEPDAYQMEYGIDYDGKVYADSIEFDGMDTLAEDVIQAVEKLFGVADESDDDDESPSE
tara:strand:- start:187 stop:564 length:378 start_codon:yes stop_codon:yes gene_type:complete